MLEASREMEEYWRMHGLRLSAVFHRVGRNKWHRRGFLLITGNRWFQWSEKLHTAKRQKVISVNYTRALSKRYRHFAKTSRNYLFSNALL